ncbi:MAG TPA: TonB-dependent receptor [Oligoflexales bacterium]|nr:TonB-dependent receptor [Oligoflexales bacterium]
MRLLPSSKTPNAGRSNLIKTLLFLVASLVASVAHSDDLPNPEMSPDVIELPAIEVYGDYEPQVPKAQSVRVEEISSTAEIEAPQGPVASVARLPAVQILSQGGPAQGATAAIRGTDPSGTLATLDDVPLNSPFMGGADLSTLALMAIDGLELERGGRSAAHGTDAVGGVITAKTRDPLFDPGSQASLMVGSWNTVRLKASHAHLWDAGPHDVAALVGGGFILSGGTFNFMDTNGALRRRENNGTLGFNVISKLGILLASDHRIDVLVEGGQMFRDIAGLEQFPSTTAKQQDTRVVTKLAWEGPKLYGDRGVTKAAFYYRRLGFAYQDSAPPSGPAIETLLISHGIGANFDTAGRLHPWIVLGGGLSTSYDKGFSTRLGSPSKQPSRTTVAGNVNSLIGPPSELFQINLNFRLEWDQGFGVRPIPALGIYGDPVKFLRLFGNISRGFRLPTLEELYFDAGYVRGNPDLIPEDALTWDAGVEFGHNEPWGFTATYFENYIKNLIMFLPRSAFLVRAENSQSATIRGVELQGRWNWRWFNIVGSYTFLHGKFNTTKTKMPQRPAHVVSGQVQVKLGPVLLSAMPSWQSFVYLDRFESLSEEDRFCLDARFQLEIKSDLYFAVEGLNLTNKLDAVDYLQRPLPGRSIFLTMRYGK